MSLRRASLSWVASALIVMVVLAVQARAPEAMAQTAVQVSGDPVRGGRLFLQCRACHTVGAAERNGVGPNLHSIVGARAASRTGYSYSPALAASGLTWTPQTLDSFLARPATLVPGTRMGFAGVPSNQNRQDLIAYLSSLNARPKGTMK